LVHRFFSTSLTSYILFLLPLLLSQVGQIDLYISLIILGFSAILAAVISGLLTPRVYPFAPPLIGSLAAFATNHLLGAFLTISLPLYFSWQYLLAVILASLLAAVIGKTKRKPSPRVEEVGMVERLEEVELITCPSCGQQIPLGSIYCPLCGARIVEER